MATVATGNVHAHDRRRAELQDAFVAVRLHTTLEEAEPPGAATPARCSRPRSRWRTRSQTTRRRSPRQRAWRSGLRFDLDLASSATATRELEDPEADRALAEICRGRLELRYQGTLERPEAERRLEEELRVIRGLGLGVLPPPLRPARAARDVAAEVRGPDSARSSCPAAGAARASPRSSAI